MIKVYKNPKHRINNVWNNFLLPASTPCLLQQQPFLISPSLRSRPGRGPGGTADSGVWENMRTEAQQVGCPQCPKQDFCRQTLQGENCQYVYSKNDCMADIHCYHHHKRLCIFHPKLDWETKSRPGKIINWHTILLVGKNKVNILYTILLFFLNAYMLSLIRHFSSSSVTEMTL